MPFGSEQEFYQALLWAVAAGGLIAAAVLFFVPAPYGRHTRRGFGPRIAARTAWIVMEAPAVLWFLPVYAAGRKSLAPAPLFFAGLWCLHYVHRTFVYPVRTYRPGERPTPLSIVVLGFTFNAANAYLNARWLSHFGCYGGRLPDGPSFYGGVLLFLAGLGTNRWADARLRRLRAQGRGYQIPRGGLFSLVSCPNYLGEIVEWTGFALATDSPAAWVFAFFTACNLVPRARVHHLWYRKRFPDYPRRRKALVPLLW